MKRETNTPLRLERLEARDVPDAVPIGTVTMPFDGSLSAAVYDPDGQIVRTLKKAEAADTGDHHLVWDGRDDFGNVLPNGDYEWRAIVSQAAGRDDGNVGDGDPPYGPTEHSDSVRGLA